jgi:Uma2 family endonuclease
MYQRSYELDGPLPPSETLPTMYDLPSEDPEEPGLPDEFHDFQPDLLRDTFVLRTEPSIETFIAANLNLYYDSRHPRWYKRPDWFLVLNANPLASPTEMRLSYVMWQETVAPFLVVELLSPGTVDEDLGKTLRAVDRPPTKWQVYEQILRVPYYALFDRYTNVFRLFRLEATRYKELELVDSRMWFEELELGLGLWDGSYEGFERPWLRWYDESSWIATPIERAEAETQRANQAENRADAAERRAERLAAKLRELGIEE